MTFFASATSLKSAFNGVSGAAGLVKVCSLLSAMLVRK